MPPPPHYAFASAPISLCTPTTTATLHHRVVYDRGFVRGFSTMGTPVRPGVSRVFARFSFGSFDAKANKTLMAELFSRLPHWAFIRNTLADQDTVVNSKQVGVMCGWVRMRVWCGWVCSCVSVAGGGILLGDGAWYQGCQTVLSCPCRDHLLGMTPLRGCTWSGSTARCPLWCNF